MADVYEMAIAPSWNLRLLAGRTAHTQPNGVRVYYNGYVQRGIVRFQSNADSVIDYNDTYPNTFSGPLTQGFTLLDADVAPVNFPDDFPGFKLQPDFVANGYKLFLKSYVDYGGHHHFSDYQETILHNDANYIRRQIGWNNPMGIHNDQGMPDYYIDITTWK